LISRLIYSSVQLHSALGLGVHLILSPARLTASVSADARVFSICFSISQPDRDTDARASPCKLYLIYTALSPDLRTASSTSRRSFCFIAAPLPASRCLVAALLSSPAASAIPVVLCPPLAARDGIPLEQTPPNLSHEC
jgi:hypothetical protein